MLRMAGFGLEGLGNCDSKLHNWRVLLKCQLRLTLCGELMVSRGGRNVVLKASGDAKVYWHNDQSRVEK